MHDGPPKRYDKVISQVFPTFKLGNMGLKYVQSFKYLGHIITNKLSDDDDIMREVRNMFVGTNILFRRFHKCSITVKILLFKSYVIFLYDAALWRRYKVAYVAKLRSCYHKCMKYFFGYNRFDSVTMLLETGLPSFDTVLSNCRVVFDKCVHMCDNMLVRCRCA